MISNYYYEREKAFIMVRGFKIPIIVEVKYKFTTTYSDYYPESGYKEKTIDDIELLQVGHECDRGSAELYAMIDALIMSDFDNVIY